MRDAFIFVRSTEKVKILILALGLIFLSYRIGLSIVYPNPYFWLILIAIPIAIVLLKKGDLGIILIMFSVFFADWLYGLGLIPSQLTWLPETILIILALKVVATKKRLIGSPIDIPIVLFILVGFVSTFANSTSLISTFLAFRLDLKFVLMFYVLINLDFKERFFKQMIKVLIVLLILQVPVALIKFLKFGQNEASIGTYGTFGGALSAILPLIAISLFTGLYLFENEKPRGRYLLFIIGYLFFPIMAGKKGFIAFGILLVIFLAWQAKDYYLRRIIVIGLIALPCFFASIYFIPALRPMLENPRYLWEYTVSYSTRRFGPGEDAGGRMGAIEETYKALTKDSVHIFVGYGPGRTIKSYFKEYDMRERRDIPVRIIYGFTHLVSTAIEYGYLGVMLIFLLPLLFLFKMNIKFIKNTTDKYWKAISFGFSGILFSYLFIGLFYWELFRIDLAAFIFWFFAAVIFSVGKQKKYFDDGNQTS